MTRDFGGWSTAVFRVNAIDVIEPQNEKAVQLLASKRGEFLIVAWELTEEETEKRAPTDEDPEDAKRWAKFSQMLAAGFSAFHSAFHKEGIVLGVFDPEPTRSEP